MGDIIERYEAMKGMLRSFFLDPKDRIVLISGENGVGKTFQIESIAAESGYRVLDHRDSLQKSDEKKLLVTVGGGKFGPRFLYEFLYNHNSSVVHFEENIFVQSKNRPVLMDIALNDGLLKNPGISGNGIPEDFSFRGGIIITTYQPLETIPEEIRDAIETINVRVHPDPADMIRLVRHELESIVTSYNKKMPENRITLEEATRALDVYESVFEEEQKKKEIQVFHMASIFWSFELLRTMTWPDYDDEIKRKAIQKSFDETPGLVTPGE